MAFHNQVGPVQGAINRRFGGHIGELAQISADVETMVAGPEKVNFIISFKAPVGENMGIDFLTLVKTGFTCLDVLDQLFAVHRFNMFFGKILLLFHYIGISLFD